MSTCEASVVVATRQRSALLPTLVRALSGQTGVSCFEIILVDDGSTDGTPGVLSDLARQFPQLRFERLPERRGPAAARNLGWRGARADIIAFTDDDCLPEPTWLAALVAAHGGGFDVVQGRTQSGTPDAERGTYSNVVEVRSFSHLLQTCNISYRREVLGRLGGFDETFGFSAGGAPNGEDADLGWRAVESGATATFAPDAVVVHPVAPRSFGRAWLARLRAMRMVYFVRRHPRFREHAVARVFFQRSHPYALVGLLGIVPLCVTRSSWAVGGAVIGFVPYALFRWRVQGLVGRRRYQPALIAGAWLIDCTEVLVMLAASVRWRTLFL
jgi:GT2 family glycosyltransferase